jgi:hypothetical protein
MTRPVPPPGGGSGGFSVVPPAGGGVSVTVGGSPDPGLKVHVLAPPPGTAVHDHDDDRDAAVVNAVVDEDVLDVLEVVDRDVLVDLLLRRAVDAVVDGPELGVLVLVPGVPPLHGVVEHVAGLVVVDLRPELDLLAVGRSAPASAGRARRHLLVVVAELARDVEAAVSDEGELDVRVVPQADAAPGRALAPRAVLVGRGSSSRTCRGGR